MLGYDELVNRGLELVVEKSLLLQLRVVPEEQVGLTIQDFTGHFGVLVEEDLASGELGVDADYAVESHDGIGPQDELLRVALLRLIWVVQHGLLMEEQFSVLGDIL